MAKVEMSDWDLRKLQQSLEKSQPASLYLLHGEEFFLVEQALRAIFEKCVTTDTKDFNYDSFVAGDVNVERVRDAVEQLPMMTDRRLVIYKNIDSLKEKDWDVLQPLLSEPVASTTFVLVADKIDKRKKVFKVIADHGVIVELRRPFENQIPVWIEYIAHLTGLKLEQDATHAILQLVGTNLSEVASEMKKIKSFLGDRHLVKVDDVLTVVSKARIENVFNLTEAISRRDRAGALMCLANLLEHGQNEMGILALILRQLRIFSQLQSASKKGLSGARLSSAVGVPDFFLRKYQAQARHWDEGKIDLAIRALHDTDRALKSTKVPSHIWLENFILKTC